MYKDINLTIGDYCSIASGVRIESGYHPTIDNPDAVSTFPFKEQYGLDYSPCTYKHKVTIGNDVWIATKAVLLDGITIGDGAIVASYAVVTKDVPPYAMVAGNPARIKYFRFIPEQIEKLLRIKWWNWKEDRVKETVPYMKDIKTFLKIYE